MPTKKYPVALTAQEIRTLKAVTRTGTRQAREIIRAQALLMANQGKNDAEMSVALEIAPKTAFNIRARYAEGGIDRALYDAPRPGQPPKLNGHEEARVVAIACTKPPEGHGKWTLDLLTEKVRKNVKDDVGRTTIHTVLLRNELKPWREKNVVHPEDKRRIRAKNDGRAGGV